MLSEAKIVALLRWLQATYENEEQTAVPEPTSFPAPGTIYYCNQAVDVLRWVLEE